MSVHGGSCLWHVFGRFCFASSCYRYVLTMTSVSAVFALLLLLLLLLLYDFEAIPLFHSSTNTILACHVADHLHVRVLPWV